MKVRKVVTSYAILLMVVIMLALITRLWLKS